MRKPYIFGHRGAMAYEIENTLISFKTAVEMGAGIETDVHLTRDERLICFHDPGFTLKDDSYIISQLSVNEVQSLPFEDGRIVPTLKEVFDHFKEHDGCLRYSCDIGNRKVGVKLIDLVNRYNLFERLEITDLSPRILYYLRKKSDAIKLVHTIPYTISKITHKTVNFDKLKENDIDTVNVKQNRANEENLREIIDQGFNFYVWGVNSTVRMKNLMKFKYKEEYVKAIYTNYPDKCYEIRENLFCD